MGALPFVEAKLLLSYHPIKYYFVISDFTIEVFLFTISSFGTAILTDFRLVCRFHLNNLAHGSAINTQEAQFTANSRKTISNIFCVDRTQQPQQTLNFYRHFESFALALSLVFRSAFNFVPRTHVPFGQRYIMTDFHFC